MIPDGKSFGNAQDKPPSASSGRTKSVGIWIRVSTEDQARGDSPEHHEKRARYYAESKGWEVKEVYHLEAVSGKSVMEHPEAKRMLKDIKGGHISGIIFSKLARLARNTKELLDFADIFKETNADLISLQEAIDTSTPAGRLFYTIIAAMAQWEREEISSRVAASVVIRAKLGKPLGGGGPFGYRWIDKKLVPDFKEAPIRKLMYELFAQHKRLSTVARILNEKGYRTRRNQLFTKTTIHRLIMDPTAKGLRRANYVQNRDRNWKLKPESEWIHNEIPAIVSEELWESCVRILEGRKRGDQVSKKTVHLFAGFLYCGCGQKMYVPSNTPKYVCWKCRNKIPIEDLEAVFHEQLKRFLLSPEEVAKYLENADQTIKEKALLLEAILKEKDQVRRNMDKVMKLYLQDQISSKGFAKEYQPLEERLVQLENQIPELQGELDFLKIKAASSDQIAKDAVNLYERWPELGPEEKRTIVEAITDKITIAENEIKIDLTYLPNPLENMANGARSLARSFPFCHLILRTPKEVAKRRKRRWRFKPTSPIEMN